MSDVGWMRDGACVAHPRDVFVWDESLPPRDQQAAIAEAKAVCAGCSAIEECRRYVMAVASRSMDGTGVWAAMTPPERRAARRRARQAA